MSLLDNITGLFDVSAESKKANEAWVDNAISATDYLKGVPLIGDVWSDSWDKITEAWDRSDPDKPVAPYGLLKPYTAPVATDRPFYGPENKPAGWTSGAGSVVSNSTTARPWKPDEIDINAVGTHNSYNRGYDNVGDLKDGWALGLDGVPYNTRIGGPSAGGGGGTNNGYASGQGVTSQPVLDTRQITQRTPSGSVYAPDMSAYNDSSLFNYTGPGGTPEYTYGQGLRTQGADYGIWGSPTDVPNPYYEGQFAPEPQGPADGAIGMGPVVMPPGIPPVSIQPPSSTNQPSMPGFTSDFDPYKGEALLNQNVIKTAFPSPPGANPYNPPTSSLESERNRRQAESDARIFDAYNNQANEQRKQTFDASPPYPLGLFQDMQKANEGTKFGNLHIGLNDGVYSLSPEPVIDYGTPTEEYILDAANTLKFEESDIVDADKQAEIDRRQAESDARIFDAYNNQANEQRTFEDWDALYNQVNEQRKQTFDASLPEGSGDSPLTPEEFDTGRNAFLDSLKGLMQDSSKDIEYNSGGKGYLPLTNPYPLGLFQDMQKANEGTKFGNLHIGLNDGAYNLSPEPVIDYGTPTEEYILDAANTLKFEESDIVEEEGGVKMDYASMFPDEVAFESEMQQLSYAERNQVRSVMKDMTPKKKDEFITQVNSGKVQLGGYEVQSYGGVGELTPNIEVKNWGPRR